MYLALNDQDQSSVPKSVVFLSLSLRALADVHSALSKEHVHATDSGEASGHAGHAEHD